ncbi:hypothetical protein [Sedimenticola sp.]|uniref:hypothetical protein n=1 Tax=Sedimenticola sp. TaxID=1940285 RepID=UPI0025855C1B|nr:hypothetical protein [Sedimenticola sp.]MCW8902465.1 hypothetical protein [Sedimenticola sp.]
MMLGRLGTLLLLLLLITACSNGEKTPEEQIRELLDTGEQAVESRSLSAVSPLLSAAYSGGAGRNKQAIMRLLAGYFVAHQSIHLLTQVSRLELIGEQRAEVTLFVAVAGQPFSGISQLLSMRADLIRLDLTLAAEQGEWQVQSGEWRRAEKRDFLE